MKIHPSPYEQVTSLTDVVMGLLAVWCAVNIATLDGFKADIWTWAFGLLAFSSLIGAAVHGFVMSEKTYTR